MKSTEFLTEGDDKDIKDVKANHPGVYSFIENIIGYMALEQQSTVEAYNTANSHMVVVNIQPSAGIGNTKAGLEAAGIAYNSVRDPINNREILEGSIGEMHWTISDGGYRGNIKEQWRFALPHKNDETQDYSDRTPEEVDEGDAVKGDFGAKGGPKPQTQNMKSISMAQAFGSDAYNVLAKAGIKFHEKPSYWSDLERDAIGEHGVRRADMELDEVGIDLPEYPAWQIFPINPDFRSAYVRGPLASVENMPKEKVFVIYDLPYSDERHGVTEPKIGRFLVDRQGASSYIRFWRQID